MAAESHSASAQNQRPSARSVPQILRTIDTTRAPQPNSDTRGVNDPQPDTGGATVAGRHRGRSRPAFPPPSGRAPDGRHRAPSDRSVISRASSRISACWLQREHNWAAHTSAGIGPRLALKGTTSKFRCPPFRPLFRTQPGRRRNNAGSPRVAGEYHAVGRLGDRSPEDWRAPLRRRRQGGSDAGPGAKGRCTRPSQLSVELVHQQGRLCVPEHVFAVLKPQAIQHPEAWSAELLGGLDEAAVRDERGFR